MMKADGLAAVRQRLDSTHVMSNIAVLTRLGLFTETVTNFLRDLRRDAPAKLVWLGEGYTERYLDREGYGMWAASADDPGILPRFLERVPECARTLAKYRQVDNSQLLAAVDEWLVKVATEPR